MFQLFSSTCSFHIAQTMRKWIKGDGGKCGRVQLLVNFMFSLKWGMLSWSDDAKDDRLFLPLCVKMSFCYVSEFLLSFFVRLIGILAKITEIFLIKTAIESRKRQISCKCLRISSGCIDRSSKPSMRCFAICETWKTIFIYCWN